MADSAVGMGAVGMGAVGMGGGVAAASVVAPTMGGGVGPQGLREMVEISRNQQQQAHLQHAKHETCGRVPA